MAYYILEHTYDAYLDMVPSLNIEQKQFIYHALVRAREEAMSVDSVKDKDACFTKVEDIINDYLSNEGYNLVNTAAE